MAGTQKDPVNKWMWLNTRTHNFGGNMVLASKTAPSEPLFLMLTPLCALFSQSQYWPTDQSDQQNAGKGMVCGSQVLITEKLLLTPWMASPGKPRSPVVRFPWWRTEASHQKPASTWQSYKLATLKQVLQSSSRLQMYAAPADILNATSWKTLS